MKKVWRLSFNEHNFVACISLCTEPVAIQITNSASNNAAIVHKQRKLPTMQAELSGTKKLNKKRNGKVEADATQHGIEHIMQQKLF